VRPPLEERDYYLAKEFAAVHGYEPDEVYARLERGEIPARRAKGAKREGAWIIPKSLGDAYAVDDALAQAAERRRQACPVVEIS
jgi:hypothetical protein